MFLCSVKILHIIGTASIVDAEQGLRNGTVSVRLTTRLSVPACALGSKLAAAG